MEAQAIVDRLQSQCGNWLAGSRLDVIDPWVEVRVEGLIEVCRFLRDDPQLRMNLLNCITGVDYFEPDAKKAAKLTWQPHFEMVYHLSSLVHHHRLVLKVMLPRWKDDVEGQLPEVPSVSKLWNTADWHEREVFDLCGIRFMGHEDLRRILCPEDWEGHPLRKDYEQPEQYHGIRSR